MSSDWFDSYKITSPLVKITKASEKSNERLVDGLVEKDTIKDTINLLLRNELTVFEEMKAHTKHFGTNLFENEVNRLEAQIKLNLARVERSEMGTRQESVEMDGGWNPLFKYTDLQGFTQIGGLLPYYFTAKSAKIAKDSVALALFAAQYHIKIIFQLSPAVNRHNIHFAPRTAEYPCIHKAP